MCSSGRMRCGLIRRGGRALAGLVTRSIFGWRAESAHEKCPAYGAGAYPLHDPQSGVLRYVRPCPWRPGPAPWRGVAGVCGGVAVRGSTRERAMPRWYSRRIGAGMRHDENST
eukprot:5954305-Prymnesium_polylepis.1